MKKEKNGRVKKVFGEVTLSILDLVLTIPEAVVGAFVDQKGLIRRMESSGQYKSLPVNYINDLIHRGYLESKTENGQKTVRLTHKGLIRQVEGSGNSKRDGKWRFLSFDIPEIRKNDRNQFRRSIKRLGFRQVQKSLWVCPFVRADKIDLIIDELKIRDYVCYISAEKTDIDRHLHELFE